jgi:hypothetical protein
MKERIKLSDAARIQDIGFFERNDEVEGILISVFAPNQSITASEIMKRASSLSEAQIEALEHSLQSLTLDIGKVFIHITLWLYRKNKGLDNLKEALSLLVKYYSTFNLERDIEGELYTYRFLHVIFYYLPLFVKSDEIASLTELSDFITAYESNLEKLTADIFKQTVIIQQNAPFWVLKSLLTHYCSKKSLAPDSGKFKYLIELLLENYISTKDIHWAKNVLEDFKQCFEKAEYITLKKKVAILHYNVGLELSGLQAISILRIAANMFQQIEDPSGMDEVLGAIKRKEMTIDWKISETIVPPEHQEKIEKAMTALQSKLEELSQAGATCTDLLKCLFTDYLLPSKETVEKQSADLPLHYMITTVKPMTEGRSGILTTDAESREHWKATVLNNALMILALYKIHRLMAWFVEKYGVEGLKECLIAVYQNSIIYDEKREVLIADVIDKYLKNDFFGFVYSVIPQIEHSLKVLLENTGISVRGRDIKYLEEITLSTILSNYKENLINILGENFYEVLWLCFLYDFGLNIRNSVLHGGGLTYLSKQYAILLLFIFGFISYRAYQLRIADEEENLEA